MSNSRWSRRSTSCWFSGSYSTAPSACTTGQAAARGAPGRTAWVGQVGWGAEEAVCRVGSVARPAPHTKPAVSVTMQHQSAGLQAGVPACVTGGCGVCVATPGHRAAFIADFNASCKGAVCAAVDLLPSKAAGSGPTSSQPAVPRPPPQRPAPFQRRVLCRPPSRVRRHCSSFLIPCEAARRPAALRAHLRVGRGAAGRPLARLGSPAAATAVIAQLGISCQGAGQLRGSGAVRLGRHGARRGGR